MQLFTRRWPSPNHPVAVAAAAAAEKILLLHGMGGTGSLWRPIAASLENDFDLLSPDQRGHGSSQVPAIAGGRAPARYGPLDYGEDLVETLDALQFHPTWVLGHSMGVRSATALAHLKPQWIRGLVLIDLGFSGVAGGGLGEGLAKFIRVLPKTFPNRAEARNFMERECPDPSIAQYLMAVSVQAGDGTLSFPFDSGALIETIAAARDISVRPWIREAGQAGIPCLVLRGAESLVWSHAEFEAERKAMSDLPSIQFEEVAGAGHGLPFEKRLEFVKRVREFIRR